MTRGRALLVGAVAIVGAGAGWWLFGFTTFRRDNSQMTFRRFFGRVTRIDSSVAVDGKIRRDRILFPWSDPYVPGDPMTTCGAIFPEVWQDRNGDGTWDTWLRRVGPDAAGDCKVEYRVDTKGTGQPDWMFVMAYKDFKKADELMKARRGF